MEPELDTIIGADMALFAWLPRSGSRRCTSSMGIHSTEPGSARTCCSSRFGDLRYESSTSGSKKFTYIGRSGSNASRVEVVVPVPRAPKRKNELPWKNCPGSTGA